MRKRQIERRSAETPFGQWQRTGKVPYETYQRTVEGQQQVIHALHSTIRATEGLLEDTQSRLESAALGIAFDIRRIEDDGNIDFGKTRQETVASICTRYDLLRPIWDATFPEKPLDAFIQKRNQLSRKVEERLDPDRSNNIAITSVGRPLPRELSLRFKLNE